MLDIHWGSPSWLWALLPLAAVLFFMWRRHFQRTALPFSHLGLLAASGVKLRSASPSSLPIVCISLGLVALTLALARPQALAGAIYSPSRGLDIMLCIDTSGSMRNTDIEPNRLEAAKRVARDFVAGRPGDRIGLIVIGGVAMATCPLTVDHAALDHYLDSLMVGITGVDHTAIGEGIAAAVARLSEVEGEGRVIILVTDGRNNVGEIDPYMAAQMAAQYGIHLYTIGIGAPPSNALSGLHGEDISGEELDEPCLRELASRASGQYFRVGDSQGLRQVFAKIDTLEKREVSQELLDYNELYPWFILFGALLLVGGIVLDNTLYLELP